MRIANQNISARIEATVSAPLRGRQIFSAHDPVPAASGATLLAVALTTAYFVGARRQDALQELL